MRKTKLLLTVQIVLFCFLVSATAQAQMSSSSYRISTTVLSGGGGNMASASYQMSSTLGQPSPPGYAVDSVYQLNSGFWYTILVGSLIGDVNGDGVVNLEDVIYTLQIITGETPAHIYQEADADGDGKIGLGEAIMILRKLGGT